MERQEFQFEAFTEETEATFAQTAPEEAEYVYGEDFDHDGLLGFGRRHGPARGG